MKPPGSSSENRVKAPLSSNWLARWVRHSPIDQIDDYALGIRWGTLFIASLSSLLIVPPEGTLVPTWMVILGVLVYNVPITFYSRKRLPLAHGQVTGLLLGDVVQLVLTITLTGGYRSFFAALSLLVMTEVALSFHWRVAASWVVGIAALQMVTADLPQAFQGDLNVAHLIVIKFMLLLMTGGLLILFSELVRREEAARHHAAALARRIAALNEIFWKLGENHLNPGRIYAVLLDSTRHLADVVFSVVLQPQDEGHWQVVASNSQRHPVGKQLPLSGVQAQKTVLTMGAGCSRPLPHFVSDEEVGQWVQLLILAPDSKILGLMGLGRRTHHPLSEDEQLFLHSLALEAGLALRNTQLYTQEREHTSQLKQFRKLQATFFSAIGHQLKTPLAVLKLLAPSLAQLAQLPQQTQTEITETVERNLSRLETLISDLLESARLETEAPTLHLQPVNLARLLQRNVARLVPLFERVGQRVALHTPAAPLRVLAEARRVEQVLSNLLLNAAKFAPKNSTVEVQVSRRGSYAQVCVSDSGPGVAAEIRDHIFEKFRTATSKDALAGAGLGLFICRELVRLHGGRIWVEDPLEGGSRFCFTLPLVCEEDDEDSTQENSGH